jgi:hypothetical protein
LDSRGEVNMAANLAELFKEKAYGHPELWECSLQEFIDKVSPVVQEHWNKHNLKKKVVLLAASFLRIKFERKELKGTIEYEVCSAIECAAIYFVNVLGEEV